MAVLTFFHILFFVFFICHGYKFQTSTNMLFFLMRHICLGIFSWHFHSQNIYVFVLRFFEKKNIYSLIFIFISPLGFWQSSLLLFILLCIALRTVNTTHWTINTKHWHCTAHQRRVAVVAPTTNTTLPVPAFQPTSSCQ